LEEQNEFTAVHLPEISITTSMYEYFGKVEPQKDRYIWRYVDVVKFLDLLNSQSLYFCRPDLFDDHFEGSITRYSIDERHRLFEINSPFNFVNATYPPEFWSEYYRKQRLDYAVNCWHLNENESAAMWKLYLQTQDGICIRSTYGRLTEILNESNHSFFVGDVKYIDYDKDRIGDHRLFAPFFFKRRSFMHENELRAVIWNEEPSNGFDLSAGGCKVKVDLEKLVESVYVSPTSGKIFTSLVSDIISKFGYTFNLVNSKLNNTPLF
jgi:hypothetical protein